MVLKRTKSKIIAAKITVVNLNMPIICFLCEYEFLGNINYNFIAGITNYNYGTINHCLNNGSVSGINAASGIVHEWAGTISCINTGKITASDFDSEGSTWWIGVSGIAGTNQKRSITNCLNTGSVEGIGYLRSRNSGGIGGICGYATGSSGEFAIITGCINTGFIMGRNYVGGILGNFFDGVNTINCVNTGVVEGEEDVGAIVGKE